MKVSENYNAIFLQIPKQATSSPEQEAFANYAGKILDARRVSAVACGSSTTAFCQTKRYGC